MRRDVQTVVTDAPRRGAGWWLLALALLLVAGISGGGWFYLRKAQAKDRRVAEETLASIAHLKAGQIAGWMKERRADAEVAIYKMQARRFLTEPDNAAVREELLQWMTTFTRIYDYSAVALFDARGAVRLAAPAGATILGDVTIGTGSIIGGNVWLIESVPPMTVVYQEGGQVPEYTAHVVRR
jgi:hypothetical protein